MKKTAHTTPVAGLDTRLVEMGVFSSPHGIRGHIKLRSYTENPEDITAYGPLYDKQGNSYTLTITGQTGDALLATVEGINDRTAAERLKNITLYVPRSALPALPAGQYYQDDLCGLQVDTLDGKPFGRILSVHNFGAGPLVNIALAEGGEEFMPFNPQTFPTVDLEHKRAVIDPPFVIKGNEEDE